MVETRASKKARELGRPQEVAPLVVQPTPTYHFSLVSFALQIHLAEPLHSDCSGFYAKTSSETIQANQGHSR